MWSVHVNGSGVTAVRANTMGQGGPLLKHKYDIVGWYFPVWSCVSCVSKEALITFLLLLDRHHNCLRCVVMELTSTQLTEAADDVVCSCRPVQTLTAGPACKLLTKNAIFQSPEDDGSILVCAGDEASNSAMVLLCTWCWNGKPCLTLLD